MNTAFPEANIDGYDTRMAALSLPDPDDRHVLAAAIESGAQVIITFNLKDFPTEQLKPFDIEAQDPDTFISHLVGIDRPDATQALHNLVSSLRNPPRTSSRPR